MLLWIYKTFFELLQRKNNPILKPIQLKYNAMLLWIYNARSWVYFNVTLFQLFGTVIKLQCNTTVTIWCNILRLLQCNATIALWFIDEMFWDYYDTIQLKFALNNEWISFCCFCVSEWLILMFSYTLTICDTVHCICPPGWCVIICSLCVLSS